MCVSVCRGVDGVALKHARRWGGCLVCEDDWVGLFFKQKTAYEVLRSLVGSEMCIRDRQR